MALSNILRSDLEFLWELEKMRGKILKKLNNLLHIRIRYVYYAKTNEHSCIRFDFNKGLRTPNEGINQSYLKNWADVADKICFGRT